MTILVQSDNCAPAAIETASVASTLPAVAGERRQPRLAWSALALHDHFVMYISFALLILSVIDKGVLGLLVKFCWLVSFAGLVVVNIGAAFAVFVSAIVIYASIQVDGWASFSDHPYNFALPVLCAGLLYAARNKQHTGAPFRRYVLAFVLFCVLNGALFGVYSRTVFAWQMRALCIPLVLSELLFHANCSYRELRALVTGLMVLGGYCGFVSVLEQLHAYQWILPPWVGDRSLTLNVWMSLGRSGGVLMQPAWNALLLALILSLTILYIRMLPGWAVLLSVSLCGAGIFFSYCRGAWLALACSMLWFPGWCSSKKTRFFRRVLIIVGAVLFLAVAGGAARARLDDTSTELYRFDIWGAGLRLVASHPLLGIGFGNFPSAMESVAQGLGALSSGPELATGDAAHNTPLSILAEFGAIGFAFWVAAVWQSLKSARQGARRCWGSEGASWVAAIVILYFVNAQFVTEYEFTTNVLFFGVLGAIAGARYHVHTLAVDLPSKG